MKDDTQVLLLLFFCFVWGGRGGGVVAGGKNSNNFLSCIVQRIYHQTNLPADMERLDNLINCPT